MSDLRVGDVVYVKGTITEIISSDTYSIEQVILAPFGASHEVGRNTSMIPASEVIAQSEVSGTGKRRK